MIVDPIERRLRVVPRRTDERIRLAHTSIRLVSNLAEFRGAAFFSACSRLAGDAAVDHELWCIDDPALRDELPAPSSTGGYRRDCFAIGYYATDHFGAPVVLYRFGNRHYLIGEELERVVWPFFVKYFVFAQSVADETLFLKGAAVAFGERGVLIAGRGGGGKTTFVAQLCGAGARFVTNSHAVIDGLRLTGVASTMRVRPGRGAWPQANPSGLREGEILVDPYTHYSGATDQPVVVQHLCIVDRRPGRDEGIVRLAPSDAVGFLQRFALGLDVYRLEEDLMELCDHDVARFSRVAAGLDARLRNLAESVPCLLARTDMLDPYRRAAVLAALGEGS
jgi:hypothetical protein